MVESCLSLILNEKLGIAYKELVGTQSVINNYFKAILVFLYHLMQDYSRN